MTESIKKKFNIRWTLLAYDIFTFAVVDAFLVLVLSKDFAEFGFFNFLVNSLVALACVLVIRFLFDIYRQIWRFGGIQCYLRLLMSDFVAFAVFLSAELLTNSYLGAKCFKPITVVALMSANFIVTLAIRMLYRYCFKYNNDTTERGKFMRKLLGIFAFDVSLGEESDVHKIYVAIVGAGSVGVSLAEELLSNKKSAYVPKCFFDTNDQKTGREIKGLPVYQAKKDTYEILKHHSIKEVILALPPTANKKDIYEFYKKSGCKIKTYDYPAFRNAGGKRQLREFDIEDLLFRDKIQITNPNTSKYYCDKTVLITGGGGSIGSELCRQLAKMKPKKIIILDIYENGVYDVQQELKFKYGKELDMSVEIASITDKQAMSVVFDKYRPQIVINAAAHKHVPLMEHNCVEAVKNNVFGTKTVLELCEEYGAERFMMVSTDKAVNPTNVMGATKRMCEMIAQGYSTRGKVKCSCTRFGNVLGSAGSVIPLFKRQIAAGGPVTLTDKRIIRYFMTIPEASQLVLESGALAKNGELFVLDMGQPIKIYDLAQNMISLSGAENIEIVETGLRPGEKLYEELLVDTRKLDTTDNELIFIEREKPIDYSHVEEKLELLTKAVASGDNDTVRQALRSVVPTYKNANEVNKNAQEAMEMHIVRKV